MTIGRLALVPLALVAACSSSPTRFWTVEPVSGVAVAAPAHGIAPVQIAAVHVPLAIDRLEVVQHDVADRISVHDFDRWSAPPGTLIRAALTQDLVARMPAGSVIFPDAPAPPATRTIVVDILDLRQDADGFAMQVSWSPSGKGAAAHALRLTAPVGTGNVAAQSRAVAQMTGQIADAIAQTLAR